MTGWLRDWQYGRVTWLVDWVTNQEKTFWPLWDSKPRPPDLDLSLLYRLSYEDWSRASRGWDGCYSQRFVKFPDFFLTNVNFLSPTEITVSQISPDNGFNPPLTAILFSVSIYFYFEEVTCSAMADPFIFWPNWSPKGRKKLFWDHPPLSQGLDDRLPPPYLMVWIRHCSVFEYWL